MSDEDYSLLDGMARQGKTSRSEILCEALKIKLAIDRRERAAVMAGLESAKNEPLLSEEDAEKHFEAFRLYM